jgi:alpha-beta hydrolase superfamily lysophospholipase
MDHLESRFTGCHHELFNELGKEQVLADVENWLDRHLET